MRNQAIEDRRRPALEWRIRVARNSLRRYDVVALLKELYHVWQQLRRILKIGVHYDDGISSGKIESCRNGGLMAKIAAEAEHADARVLDCSALKDAGGCVRAAIV